MRNDSSLYTGINSSTVSKGNREVRAKVQERQRNEFKPLADIVLETLDKNIQSLRYDPYEDEANMSDDVFRAERRGRQIAIKYLRSLRRGIEIVMKEPDPTKKELGDWDD